MPGEGGGLRKLHNENLYYLYSSDIRVIQIKEDEMAGPCSMYGREETCIRSYIRES
jgi:hypothetical protein